MARSPENPLGLLACAGFFALMGLLQLVLGLRELPAPLDLWRLSGVLGGASLYLLLAGGLWQRFALCRSLAMVYCLAALVTHGAVLSLAYAGAPVRIPESVVISSLLEVPSCTLLLPFLRSRRAAALFQRPVLAGPPPARPRPPLR